MDRFFSQPTGNQPSGNNSIRNEAAGLSTAREASALLDFPSLLDEIKELTALKEHTTRMVKLHSAKILAWLNQVEEDPTSAAIFPYDTTDSNSLEPFQEGVANLERVKQFRAHYIAFVNAPQHAEFMRRVRETTQPFEASTEKLIAESYYAQRALQAINAKAFMGGAVSTLAMIKGYVENAPSSIEASMDNTAHTLGLLGGTLSNLGDLLTPFLTPLVPSREDIPYACATETGPLNIEKVIGELDSLTAQSFDMRGIVSGMKARAETERGDTQDTASTSSPFQPK